MTIEIGVPLGFVILVANLVAIIGIGRSGAKTQVKVLWILAVLFFPLIGFIAWLLAGPRSLPTAKEVINSSDI